MKRVDVKTGKPRRLVWASLAGASALLLVVGLSLLFSRFQALAQPAGEIAALTVDKRANTDVAAPGDTLTYTIRIEDMSASYPTLWMTDTLADEVTYVPGSLEHLELPGRSVGYADGVITWTASSFGYGFDVITFSVVISPETTATQIDNTAQVTGTGALIEDSWTTMMLTGQPPNSQIRFPDRDAFITQRDPLVISGIAWDSGVVPPYLVDDPELSVQRVDDRVYYVSWTGVVSAEHYVLQESTRPDFRDYSSTVLPESPTNLLISKGTGEDGTYYYRVQATRLGLEPSRWSNTESVVVPWTEGVAALAVPALSAELAAADAMTVQVRIDDGEWHNAVMTATDWGGWEWSYEWALPEENDVQHAIHSRASYADGVFGPTDTITVTLRNGEFVMILPLVYRRWPPVPYPATLDAIDNADEDRSYAVSWSYDHLCGPSYPDNPPCPTSYTLQESKDSRTNFVDVYGGSGTSYSFTDQENGTYYYRVRGNNQWGAGEWSDVKSTTVYIFEYFDNFSDYRSGWPREWSKTRGALYQVRPYEHPACPGSDCQYDVGDGYVIARRSGSDPLARFGPEVAVPSEDYEIEVDARWWDAAYFATYQILFGADSSYSNYYAVEVRINVVGDSRSCAYRVVRHTSSLASANGFTSITGDNVLKDWTDTSKIRCKIGKSNHDSSFDHWKIRRENDEITVWVNGEKLGEWEDSRFGANRYFGVGATLYEGFTPSKPEFDNWSVVLR